MIPNEKEELPNNGTSYIRELLNATYQGVKRLFVLSYDDRINDDHTDAATRVRIDSHKKYFLP